MSSILISTAIFCLLAGTGMGVYVALYGSHRVFQERFAEMAARPWQPRWAEFTAWPPTGPAIYTPPIAIIAWS